ncbi:LSU ribosomal protein L12e (L11p) [Methanosarcina sp. MTP4]|uniref:50S ribosomal protein L11 n=1 Tax=unclassified Methanosarcina TaxID=2644672 RepID=UPI000615CE5A|nr:50S ribosomal protein L11 [Methanosarcina sp. MTP4]AKB23794.1 LSU ribosomal protein L12e (L11p) [Methanosarcina sp. MTP4]
MTSIVEALVPGGKANPGPPLGPALGPLGVNIKEVVDKINEKTRDYNGMQVPVKVIVDDKKNVEIEVGTPPTSALVMQEAGIKKGSGTAGSEVVGNLSIQQVAKIARMKKEDILSYDLKAAMKEVMGTCVPMGVTIEETEARECQKALDEGKFDDVLAGEEW